MAAVACWCTPVYAETSVQAAEQVAQQLTSANSGSLSKNALATGSKVYWCNTLIAWDILSLLCVQVGWATLRSGKDLCQDFY